MAQEPEVKSAGRRARQRAVTWRATGIGLACVVALSVITPYTDLVMQTSLIAANHLPIGPVFLLFVLIGANALVGRLAPARRLTSGELIVIFAIMLIASGIPSFGVTANLFASLVAPFYYANVVNRWAQLFHRYIPSWLAPHGEQQARWFYQGLPEGQGVPWNLWLVPIGAWFVLLMAFFWVMICLCVILRRQWSERERLAFPLIQLPLEMVAERERRPPLRSRLFWLGFAVPVVLHSLNSIAYFNPLVPTVRLKGIAFTSLAMPMPWRALNDPHPIGIYIYPSMIGLTYLIHLDASFSVWFFYALTKVESVIEAMVGVEPQYQATLLTPHQAEMGGALLALALLSLWAGRRHLREVWRKALHRGHRYDDSREGLSYRMAVFGAGGGVAVILGWLWASGVSVWAGAAFLVIFLLVAIALTRVVAETGLMFVQYSVLYGDVIGTATGSAAMSPSTLTGLALQYSHTWDLRSFLMPNAMHGLKAAEVERVPQRRLVPALLAACAIALLVGSAATLNVAYKHGGLTLHEWFLHSGAMIPFRKLATLLAQPAKPDTNAMVRAGVGAAVTLLLVKMRESYVGWPLHPAGYVICRSPWVMYQIWFSFFAGWLFKWLILRYSGIRGYLFFLPLFLGLVLGEFTAVGAWVGVDYLFGIKHHSLFPN